MQPVERIRKKSRKHGRLMLFAAVLVLLGGSIAAVCLWPRNKKDDGTVQGTVTVPASKIEEIIEDNGGITEDPAEDTDRSWKSMNTVIVEERKQIRGTLQDRNAEEVASVTVTRRGQAPWTLIRDESGGVYLKGSEGWTVKERLADQVLDTMANLVYEDIMTADPAEYRDRLAAFGLGDPYITAEVRFTDGQEMTIHLGDEVPVEERIRYMTVDGDERLYAVAYSLAEDLDVEQEALHPVNQPEIYPVLLDRLTVYGRDGQETAEWRLRGEITDQDAGTNWVITAPFRYPADEDVIQNMKTGAGNLRMGVFLGDATEDNLAQWKRAEPEYTLELHMAPGSTGTVSDLGVYNVTEREGGTVTLGISRSDNEMIDYVRFGDEIYKVSHLSLSAFVDANAEGTAARYIAPVPLNSLESITIEQNGETVTYTVERTGETDPDTAEEKVICRKDGEEISREAFEAAYERLLTVTVSGKLPKGAEWEEAHTKYTFRTVSGGTHTVELSSWDGMHDAVTMDGETRFYLICRGAEFMIH